MEIIKIYRYIVKISMFAIFIYFFDLLNNNLPNLFVVQISLLQTKRLRSFISLSFFVLPKNPKFKRADYCNLLGNSQIFIDDFLFQTKYVTSVISSQISRKAIFVLTCDR